MNFDGIWAAALPDPAAPVRKTAEMLPLHSRRASPLISPLFSRKLFLTSGIATMIVVGVGFFVVVTKIAAAISHSQGAATSYAGHVLRQPTAITNGLVAWYPLDGNANDASGNGNTGTLSNFSFDGTTNGYFPGKFGKALKFTGNYTIMKIGNIPALQLAGKSFTFSAWINPSGYRSVWEGIIGGDGSSPSIGLSGTSGLLRFTSADLADATSSTVSPPLNIWSHVLVTSNASTNVISYYVNGVAAGTATSPVPTTGNFYTNTIGNRISYDDPNAVFNGSIDDVRIYNRVLSSSEITQLYQGSQPINCDQYCVGWWKLDEGSGTTANDSTSNGNTGTLTNFSSNSTDGWTNGVFAGALNFNGTNPDYISIPVNQAISGSYTVSLWAYLTARNCSHIQAFFGSTLELGGFGTTLGFYNCSGQLLGTIGSTNTHIANISSAGIFYSATNTWYHIALSVSPTHYEGYVNGVQVVGGTYGSATPVLANQSNPFLIGKSDYSTDAFYGIIDDVRVYRRALANYEIYDQYLAGR